MSRRRRRGWVWLGPSLVILMLFVACGGGEAVPTPNAEPTAISAPAPPKPATPDGGRDREREYVALADEAVNGIGQLTRIISGLGIGLAGTPEDAPEAQSAVAAVKGSFELIRDQLQRSDPPPGYEELNATLLDALSFYIDASAALLPDSETANADYWRFQEAMQEGGKNAHAATAAFGELRRMGR